MHANVHDEVQFSCKPEHADELGQLFVDSIKNAGKVLKVRCPLDGEYKVGANWKETH
jgi:DNA polymerase I-like protein with 3'-5' exonuclease and polymerase domains